MAQDLIPPPSPAGRPTGEPGSSPKVEPGAKPSLFDPIVGEPLLAEPEPEPVAAEAASAEKTPPPYRSRFGFITGALIGVGLATIALLVGVLVSPSGSTAPTNWSNWKPTASDGFAAAHQIADHVSPKYRLGNGDQMVAVLSGPLEVADVPLSVALRTAPSGGDIRLLDGKGVMFTLNGLGPHGSIKGGTPSKERHLLLRREALELALYTFRYIDNVDMVVALLPPAPPKKGEATTDVPTEALFYRPGDLRPELDRPINQTIAPSTPRPDSFKGTEARNVDEITRPNLFEASFQQGQNAKAFLVLSRVAG
jgi:hypothetical protein